MHNKNFRTYILLFHNLGSSGVHLPIIVVSVDDILLLQYSHVQQLNHCSLLERKRKDKSISNHIIWSLNHTYQRKWGCILHAFQNQYCLTLKTFLWDFALLDLALFHSRVRITICIISMQILCQHLPGKL
jgi:hypothetical protein